MKSFLSIFATHLLLSLITISSLFGDEAVTSQIRFTHHNQELGLSSNKAVDILQDKSGWIWIATKDGLNQFDAHETRIHKHDPDLNDTLSSNELTCLALGDKGDIWVGTAGYGLNKFNPETRKAIRYLPGFEGSSSANHQLPSGTISSLAISERHFLWIGTDKGLAVMNMLSGKIRLVEGDLGLSRISTISVFDEKTVWVGTAKGEVYQWDNNDSIFKKLLTMNAPISSIARDTKLQVWVGTNGYGLHRIVDGNKTEKITNDIHDVNTIWSDTNGDLWVGTDSGLAKLNRGEKTFRMFLSVKGEEHSLSHNHVTAVFEDRSRMLWVATMGGGTSRFHLDRYWFPHIRYSGNGEGLPHPSIWSMAESKDDGKVWIGTERGVVRWEGENQKLTKDHPGLAEAGDPYAISLLEDTNDNLWIGTKGEGLIKISSEGEVSKYLANDTDPNSLRHNFVKELYEDDEGRIWIGTYGGGMYRYIPSRDSFEHQKAEAPLKMDYINRIREDHRGRIWAGTQEGLFVLEKGDTKWASYSALIPGDSNFPSGEISAIVLNSDFLWLGTERNGLSRINLRTGKSSHYSTTNTPDLTDDHVISLAQDDSGFLWIATPSGISRLDTVQGIFRNFSKDDGLLEGFRPNAFAFGNRRFLLFGGNDGFNHINPRKLPEIVQPPRPMLTQFEYFGKTVNPQEGEILEKPLSATSSIKIPFDARNRFAFRFANLDYRFPNQGFFRYQMVGYDQDWQMADKDRRASYQSLPVGNYVFRVQSSQNGKKWPDIFATVMVKISPPWYKNWWFRVLGSLALLAAAFFGTRTIFHGRIRAIERREAKISAQRDKAEVALARQLQHAVLLERTSRGLTQSGREDEIFSSPLKNLADHFEVDHGLIYRITEDPETDKQNGVRIIAHYAVGNATAPSPLKLDFLDPSVQQALRSESSFAVCPTKMIDVFLDSFTERPSIKSVLFVSTRFLYRTNGIIVLLSSRPPEEWKDDEIKLINALSPQFGMSIAQMKLAEKEQHYLKNLEEARHQAEVANRAKSDFLAKMTHELRTPLNSIIGFTEILQEDEFLMPKQRELVEIVNNSGDHLLDVINDILDLSKIEAGKIERSDETFELLPLLKSVYEMLGMKAKAKKIGFEFAARSALPSTVHTDRSKIRQTLINLIGNAIKFTDQGAVTMAVSASAIGAPTEVEGNMRRKVRLSFEIADTGKGISKEDLPKLFEKYGQTESGLRSSEGTGLGLPIARSFIQLLGGDIEVDSEYGRGTVFKFFFECEEVVGVGATPASAALSEFKAQKINGIRSSRTKPVRILIAEDQPNNRLLLKKILGRAGFEMAEATNGKEAVELCESWKPDLILMDEDMPVMKGSDATRAIILKAQDDEPVIVSLTAYALEQAKQSALEAGCKDFLAKPFKAHEIFTVISRHLDISYTFEDAA